jgi:hypothetical protein
MLAPLTSQAKAEVGRSGSRPCSRRASEERPSARQKPGKSRNRAWTRTEETMLIQEANIGNLPDFKASKRM